MMFSGLVIVMSILPSTLGEPDCTVERLKVNVVPKDTNVPLNKDALKENQKYFSENCSKRCVNVEVDGILRKKCSNESADGYNVYQCPKNDSLFYLLNPTKCRLIYYTMCNESANYSDPNLTETLKDLLCSCQVELEQPKFKLLVGNKSCSVLFDLNKFLYCIVKPPKEGGRRIMYIRYTQSCEFPTCEGNIDVDQERFKCKENGKGIYCDKPKRFVPKVFKCDGKVNCEADKLDEKGCDETSGVYCDADGDKVDYRRAKDVCDGRKGCDNGADESQDKCPDNYCIAQNGSSIFMTRDILCNGVTDCKDAKDEQKASCSKFMTVDGAPCDNNTKWIRQKYLCSKGKGLCEDGMDKSDRWNCDKHELCPESAAANAREILCNSTIFCTAEDSTDRTKLFQDCKNCENGEASSYKRCKDSGKGITCKKEGPGPIPPFLPILKDIFVPEAEVCDGTEQCDKGVDENNCIAGYYCTGQVKKTFIPWQKVCPVEIKEPACEDKSDQQHCDSDFFDFLTREEKKANRTINYSEYLNIELIFKQAADQIDEDILKRVLKHRAFACQEHFYNMKGPKKKIIQDTFKKQCVNETIFTCPSPYKIHNAKPNIQIMKKWLCQYPKYCGSPTVTPQIELCRNSSLCYSHEMRCNHNNDCTEYKLVDSTVEEVEDKTDEIGCSDKGLKCGPNSTVIEDAYVCDGIEDCESKVDEEICDGNNQDEKSIDECKTGERKYLLYSNLTLLPSNTYELNEYYSPVPVSCDCDKLTGEKYMVAVCNTIPNATGQPCTNSHIHNNTLCYPELRANWYTEEFTKKIDEKDVVDTSCKTQTKTLSTPNLVDGEIQYRTFVRYHNDSRDYIDKSVFCKNKLKRKDKKCGIPVTKMCDLENDCGDWSDESTDFCKNNFECKSKIGDVFTTTRVIANSNKCNGASDCDNSQDECLDECNEDGFTNTVSLLGSVGLLAVVWIFGVVSLIFNVYLIITMTKSAFDVLEKVPHRFIYRILVTTIAIGDVMVSVYLVILASADSFRDRKYCEEKEQWLTGSTCITMGVLSTFGNHVSLFAMVTLSFFRLKTVVHYLWPRSVNKAKAIRITIVLVLSILVLAVLISTIPLVGSLKDSFVDRYYFPKRGNVFERGEKKHIYQTMHRYNDKGKFNYPKMSGLSEDSSWEDLLSAAEHLFNGSVIIEGKKPYSFYSAYGVCLFNYLNSPKNDSFPYVISIIALNLVCFLTIIASYLWIWKVGTKSKSTERQLQKKLSIAVFLNILCRLPLFMICLAHSIERYDFEKAVTSEKCTGTCLYYRYMSVFVIPINSVINPFINSEADLVDMLGGRCFRKRQNIITNDKTSNSVTVGTTLTTVAGPNTKNPGYKLSKVNPPSTLEEEETTN